MKFESLYRISFYIMLFLATLVLNVEDSRENWVAWILPPAVAATAVMAFLTVDRNPRYGLSLGAATLLSWLAIVLCYLEYRMDESRLIASLTHWLVYLQLIKMFRPKTDEDEWFLILIGLVQVMVGGVLSRGGDSVGILIIAWALWTIWTLGLFYLHRAARRAPERARGPRIPKEGHYHGLIDKAFLTSSFSVAFGALILGGLIFLLMPRSNSRGPLSLSGGGKAAQTGFNSDEVSLKSAGRILENTAMVMTVALSGPDGESLGPLDDESEAGDEPLWRGSTLSRYEESAWVRYQFNKQRPRSFPAYASKSPPPPQQSLEGRQIDPEDRGWIRQDYALERLGETARFALRPILRTQSRGAAEGDSSHARPDELTLSAFDGSLMVTSSRSRIQEYSVWSGKEGPGINQEFEATPSPPILDRNDIYEKEVLEANLALDEDLKGTFARIAATKFGEIPPDQPGERARALEAWLRDSGEFAYSLALTRTDTRIDPVVDFLTNHKRGHCVYYASSLALMLRSIDVPARIVNGYKGGDWNAISRRYHIRQKHAHSWVEALIPNPSGAGHYWMTLDPTPGADRDELVAQVGGSWFPGLRQFGEAIRYYWVFYIQGFDAERQQRMIYQPIKDLAEMAGHGYQMIWDAVRGLFHFTDQQSFFSGRGFIVAFLTLTALAFLLIAARSAWKWLARWLRPGSSGKAGSGANIAFYQKLMTLLSAQGLERAEAETPREFGARAIAQLTARCGDEQLFDVPRRVIEAFYRVRYGDESIHPDESRELRAGIDRLEQALLQPA
jgi:transglutaminase-like putative cysteine protease